MFTSHLRTLLTLGRISNLPTVWSNCLAAWLLAGGSSWPRFGLLLGCATSLYLGGMFLNDACDADFDRKLRPERPIPRGLISSRLVWGIGGAWLLTGLLCAVRFGVEAFALAGALVTTILAYDFWHKRYAFAVGLVAICRFLLYCLAGAVAMGSVSGRVFLAAGGIAAYVLGISLIARHEARSSRPPIWSVALLIFPGVSAIAAGPAGNFAAVLVLFLLWAGMAIVPVWRSSGQTGVGVSRLLAGLILADWLQVTPLADWRQGSLFLFLFGLTLLLQRRVPAT